MTKLILDADADAVWRAVHSPAAAAEIYAPLLQMTPITPGELPVQWEAGQDAAVALRLGGAVPLGTQLIAVSHRELGDDAPGGPARIFRDSGIPLSGPLASLTVWDHQMAIAPAPGDPVRTLWRERLVIGGALAPLFWPTLWLLWQWRGVRLRRLARGWASGD